jgi:hypothetical protein
MRGVAAAAAGVDDALVSSGVLLLLVVTPRGNGVWGATEQKRQLSLLAWVA